MASVHVQGPSSVVFLCGGPTSHVSKTVPLSLRDAFLKIIDNPALRKHEVIQAEDFTRDFRFLDFYADVLEFETDLAQIVEMILLFCESEGSLAELGSFVIIEEIASRLLVVVRDKYWEEDSFIVLGPLRWLSRKHGRDAVCVLEDADLGLLGASISQVAISTLNDRLQEPLRSVLNRKKEPSTFDPMRSGHVIKLIVGLIQEYGALTIEEIESLLEKFQVDADRKKVLAYLYCAEAVSWVKMRSKGVKDFYIACRGSDTISMRMLEDAAEKNKQRRRLLIREHWKNNDGPRHRGIAEVFGGSL